MPKVLIVDDSEDNAILLAALLSRSGCETEFAFDGASALETAASFDPDVIFLDLGLPDMDGHQVAQKLRERNSQERPKIVALTGSDLNVPLSGLFDGQLLKPVKLEALLGFVDCDEPIA
jgi:CheY-like chemotaxis protein